MKLSKAPVNEYSDSVVPLSATVSGWQVALIKLAAVVALPAFVMGAQVGTSLGLKAGALSMTLGGLMLMAMASMTGLVAQKSRLSTSLITQFAFGRWGGRFVNAVLATTLLGWFGVTAQIFAQSAQHILSDLNQTPWPIEAYMVLGGIMMIAGTVYGFSALRRLSDITIPLLLITLLIASYRSIHTSSLEALLAIPGKNPDLRLGISGVAGGLAASICVFPDLCRFARSSGHAVIASAATYGLGLPIVLILSAVIGVRTGSQDLIIILTTLGLGIPALLLLVLKAWTTNSANLYSASLGLVTIFPNVSRVVLVIISGAIGVALSVLGITDHFIPFLLLLSITIPPIAGIYVADFFLVRGQKYDLDRLKEEPLASVPAFAAWFLGVVVSSMTSHHVITLTGISAADSILTSFFLYVLLTRYVRPIFLRQR